MIRPFNLVASLEKTNVCFTEGSHVGKHFLFVSKVRFADTEDNTPGIIYSAVFKRSRLVKISFSALQIFTKTSAEKLDAI